MNDEIKVKLNGIEPLIMHRGDLADPMDPWTKLLSAQAKVAKKDKTDAAYLELYRVEWYGSSYIDNKIGFVIPTDNIIKVVIEGARRQKLGKAVEAAVIAVGIPPNGNHDVIKLDFPGPQEQAKMWNNGESEFIKKKTLRVGQSRIVRCRPIFRKWSISFLLRYDSEIVNKETLITALNKAGQLIGLGDWRPRFGTFTVEVLKNGRA